MRAARRRPSPSALAHTSCPSEHSCRLRTTTLAFGSGPRVDPARLPHRLGRPPELQDGVARAGLRLPAGWRPVNVRARKEGKPSIQAASHPRKARNPRIHRDTRRARVALCLDTIMRGLRAVCLLSLPGPFTEQKPVDRDCLRGGGHAHALCQWSWCIGSGPQRRRLRPNGLYAP